MQPSAVRLRSPPMTDTTSPDSSVLSKTSMRDAEAGRPLEIGALLEAPREIAQLAGIATPALDDLLRVDARLQCTRTGRTDAQG